MSNTDGKMPPKDKKGKNKMERKDTQEVFVGISSAHSWIKTQTMLKPTKLGKNREGSQDSEDEAEEIQIQLTSRDPTSSFGKIR